MRIDRQRDIDLLIDQFWRRGFLTIYRKHGKYLPSPESIGGYEVDVIAKCKDSFAIGLLVADEALLLPERLLNKISFLASRQSKNSNKKVHLFIGVSSKAFQRAKLLIDQLDDNFKKNIRLLPIVEKSQVVTTQRNRARKLLFS